MNYVNKSAPDAKPILEKPIESRGSRGVFASACMILTAAIAWGAFNHWHRYAIANETLRDAETFRPVLHVTAAQKLDAVVPLKLPGNTYAFEQARIFARATGYIAERKVDIGSRVRSGDLLARISAPDLDQQLRQAEATLLQREAELQQADAQVNQAQSRKNLAHATDDRVAVLAKEGWQSPQIADQTHYDLVGQDANLVNAKAGVALKKADYQTQTANVRQLQELVGYELVTAPFDGVVTARNVDTGDLVNATNSGTPIFVVQQDNILRVRIDVPQADAVGLHDGLNAEVVLPEHPDKILKGVVARNAGAFNSNSRTLAVEVDINNEEHFLTPGQFVYVTLFVPRAEPAVVVPAGALLYDSRGLRIATVDMDNTVHLHDVTVYRDFGSSVELRSGLNGGERVAVNPPSNLLDGMNVRISEAK
jgi:HlyD family secretion protein